jgi:preprotein translocase subunit SecE
VAEKKVAHQQKNAVSRFYSETLGELKKVNWPTRQEATNLTTIVLIVIASMAVFLGLLDIFFSRVFAYLLNL